MDGRCTVPDGFRELDAAEAGEALGGSKWDIVKKVAIYLIKYTAENIGEAVDGYRAGQAAGGCGCR